MLEKQLSSQNLCESLDEETTKAIGIQLRDWFDEDEASRLPWLKRSNEWLKLATQVTEKKTYPWPDAANVKYPLLTTAAMQFSARAYPALVPGPRLVQGLVIGRDEQGLKQAIAERIGAHMSFQLLYEMDDWEEDMDRLCMILPIVGCVFKKTWFDPIKGKNVSDLILPQDLVIDYFAKTVESASRKSHIIYRNKNEIQERINKKIYCDIDIDKDLGLPTTDIQENHTKDKIDGKLEPKLSPASPYKLIESHCWWDLDDDGYEEPYIITFDYTSRVILRIVPRFSIEDVELEDDKIISIKPTEYFTKFGFIPNPDGSIYDLGFGLLLGALNETVNTLTNQLLDSGTINNLQSGFLGRGIRIRSGNTRFLPGEWKPVDFAGDDIRKHLLPLPTKEPSDVLFKLLEALVTSGKELASVAEIMVGKMPGQNTPATTTMATIEQGLKVFTAIYKRVYRALGKEYSKLFKLNKINLPDKKIYFTINEPQGAQGQEVEKTDYENDIAVKPNADPNIVSSAQKLMKVQAMGPLLELGTLNPVEYTKRFLEAIDEENISTILVTQPPPSPEQQQMQADQQMKQAEMMMKQQEQQMKMQFEQMKAQLDQQSKEMELRFKMVELQFKQKEHEMDMAHTQQEHQLNMQTQQQQSEIDLKTSKEQSDLKTAQMKEQGDIKAKQAAEKPKPQAKA